MIKGYLIIIVGVLCISFIVLYQSTDTKQETTTKEIVKQQTNDYVFVETDAFTVSGAIKIEEIGKMVDVEKFDENLNKVTTKEYKQLMTNGRYGGGVYRVTFKDGTTKRYYYQFYRGGEGEWILLDFGPYKN